ncbi:MAG: V-type ATP synthase subunit F [bacterium]|nr:V-type ATP synthase subunit F [bacterium]MDD5354055.1 V-type ATP synthase subunit F [bacterium]
MKFFCIADRDSSLGFKLAGVETLEAGSKNELLEAFKVALATESVGVIIITEKAAELGRAEVDKYIQDVDIPLILEIPSSGQVKERKSAGNILKEAMGIKI